MRERLKNKKGFTLAELLIVVAIIAILVAIMIPVFGSSRAEAALSKDAANLRSAYSEAITEAMTDETNTHYSGGKLLIDLGTAVTDAGLTFDTNTKAVYTRPDGKNGSIVLSHGGTTKTETIIIDEDVQLTKKGVTALMPTGATIVSEGKWSGT